MKMYENRIFKRDAFIKVTCRRFRDKRSETRATADSADVMQVLGLAKQYNEALKNAQDVSKALGNKELTFTGHSLGGGLAAANAYATGGRAITFNPAGVSGLTIANIAVNYGFKMVFAKIDAHVLITDPLNIFNLNTTRTDGKVNFLLPFNINSIKDGHSIDNLGKSLGIKW